MEDARFVRFVDDDGTVTYYATYTAFDGVHVAPQLLETDDFRDFRVTQITGPAARNKGMALFPRRIGGRYVALSRWDRESNAIATSADCRSWATATTLQSPRTAVGAPPARQLRLPHRDTRRLARPHPRRRPHAGLLDRRRPPRPRRPDPDAGAASRSPHGPRRHRAGRLRPQRPVLLRRAPPRRLAGPPLRHLRRRRSASPWSTSASCSTACSPRTLQAGDR